MNESQQLNVLMLWIGYCLHASSSKKRVIFRSCMKMMLCHMIEELNLVRMNKQSIKLIFLDFSSEYLHLSYKWLCDRKNYLLILDSHERHLTSQFDQICIQNDIVSICMSAHSSLIFYNLLIFAFFAFLKSTYDCLMKEKMWLEINHVNKPDFLSAYPQACKKTFKMSNIKNDLMTTDLISYNSERILMQLNIYLKTSTSSKSQSSNSDSNIS